MGVEKNNNECISLFPVLTPPWTISKDGLYMACIAHNPSTLHLPGEIFSRVGGLLTLWSLLQPCTRV